MYCEFAFFSGGSIVETTLALNFSKQCVWEDIWYLNLDKSCENAINVIGQKSTSPRQSPNLETIKDDLEDNGNDEKFFCFFFGLDFKTKQGCCIHQRNCDEEHCWFEIDTIQLDMVHLFAKWITLFDCVSVHHTASTMPISCNFSTFAINALKWSVFIHPFDKTIVLIKKYIVCNHKYYVLSQLLDIFHVLHGMM